MSFTTFCLVQRDAVARRLQEHRFRLLRRLTVLEYETAYWPARYRAEIRCIRYLRD